MAGFGVSKLGREYWTVLVSAGQPVLILRCGVGGGREMAVASYFVPRGVFP